MLGTLDRKREEALLLFPLTIVPWAIYLSPRSTSQRLKEAPAGGESVLASGGGGGGGSFGKRLYDERELYLQVSFVVINQPLQVRLEYFILSVLKSLVIPAIWLALSSVIYSRITPFFFYNITSVLNRVIHVLNPTIFALYRIISVSDTKCDANAFLFRLSNKPALDQ